jgi:hypothetical protein
MQDDEVFPEISQEKYSFSRLKIRDSLVFDVISYKNKINDIFRFDLTCEMRTKNSEKKPVNISLKSKKTLKPIVCLTSKNSKEIEPMRIRLNKKLMSKLTLDSKQTNTTSPSTKNKNYNLTNSFNNLSVEDDNSNNKSPVRLQSKMNVNYLNKNKKKFLTNEEKIFTSMKDVLGRNKTNNSGLFVTEINASPNQEYKSNKSNLSDLKIRSIRLLDTLNKQINHSENNFQVLKKIFKKEEEKKNLEKKLQLHEYTTLKDDFVYKRDARFWFDKLGEKTKMISVFRNDFTTSKLSSLSNYSNFNKSKKTKLNQSEVDYDTLNFSKFKKNNDKIKKILNKNLRIKNKLQ